MLTLILKITTIIKLFSSRHLLTVSGLLDYPSAMAMRSAK